MKVLLIYQWTVYLKQNFTLPISEVTHGSMFLVVEDNLMAVFHCQWIAHQMQCWNSLIHFTSTLVNVMHWLTWCTAHITLWHPHIPHRRLYTEGAILLTSHSERYLSNAFQNSVTNCLARLWSRWLTVLLSFLPSNYKALWLMHSSQFRSTICWIFFNLWRRRVGQIP